MDSHLHPTPLAFARLMDAVCELEEEWSVETLAAYFARPRLCEVLYRRLMRLAADAGMEPRGWDWFVDVAESDEQLDRLIAARDFRDPAEVLDPEGRGEVDYGQIANLLEARLARGQGEAIVLRRVLAKLRRKLAAAGGDDELSGGRWRLTVLPGTAAAARPAPLRSVQRPEPCEVNP